jgi:multiple sugar transport system permease protein
MATLAQSSVQPQGLRSPVTPAAPSVQPGHLRRKTVGYLPLVVLAAFFLFPIVFMFVSSLKPGEQILADLRSFRAFLPVGDISLDNYVNLFGRVPAGRFLVNSILVTVAIVVLGLIVNSMAGFALSRMEWRGRKIVFVAIIATLIVPFETIAIPMVYWVSKLPWWGVDSLGVFYDPGWLNTYRVQIIPFIANAFSIFLFAQYFSTIPRELDEAAKVDGATWFTIFRKVIAPLAGPAYATVAILSFLPAWNAYLWPLLVVQQEELRPVMVGLQYFFQGNTAEGVPWGEIMAYCSMITLPVLIMFLAFQRAFVSSIASSGMKN